MSIVTTGQITIVDQNDAKPITGTMTANPGPQQVYSKDESTTSWLPDWTTANGNTGILLTPKVYLGGLGVSIDITSQLTNPKWSTDLATAITGATTVASNASLAPLFGTGTYAAVAATGTNPSLKIKSNFLDTVPQATIYFEGDYTDLATSLTSHVVVQLTLGMVKTGTNSVYVLTRGQNVIEPATGSTKTVVAMAADLFRAAGVDTSGLTYRFFEANGATQINSTMNTKYGMKSTAYGSTPTGSLAEIGVGLPTGSAWSANNTLVIHEIAVTDIGNYRVEAKDADGTIYQAYFTIFDQSDPYQCNVISTSGDKLQNGVGSTSLTPDIYYGQAKLGSLTGWTFTWTFYNKNGDRGAFIDVTKTAAAGGRNITAHTTGVSATITYDSTNIVMVAGDIIKCVSAAGVEKFYEVLSNTANVVTIRAPVSNAWLNYTTFPAPVATEFTQGAGGKMFICKSSGGQQTSAAAAAIVVTGDEIDVKGRITVDCNRP